MNLKIARTFFVFMLGLCLCVNGLTQYKLSCEKDHKTCWLKTRDTNLRVIHMKCDLEETDECKESILIAENNHVYACKNFNKLSGLCRDLFSLNELIKGLSEETSSEEEHIASYDGTFGQLRPEPKRALPFESLNYGRRKRQLPFETLNYGKRAGLCDCYHAARSAFSHGKRGLPFDALNYGKRSGIDIPIDGYIIGKRGEY